MQANSRPVISSQTGIHERLAGIVVRHAATPFRKPVADYNRAAFEAGMDAWRRAGELPLILDAGCGVGLSTWHLAARFSDHFVIGVDQSADRIGRNIRWNGTPPENALHLRADLVDFWRLLQDAGVQLARHYLLYPNPWPKPGQLQRRWHAHPVFPTVVALGGMLECRSNWKIYIDECAVALESLTGQAVACHQWLPEKTITPFEQKYQDSGHALWRCKAHIAYDGNNGKSMETLQEAALEKLMPD